MCKITNYKFYLQKIFIFLTSGIFLTVTAKETNYLGGGDFTNSRDLKKWQTSKCSLAFDYKNKIDGKAVIKLKSKSKSATLKQKVRVPKEKLFIFSGWVKSDAAVSISISSPPHNVKRIAYNKQGSWQKITGLFDSKSSVGCSFQLTIRRLKASGTPSALLRDFKLYEAGNLPIPVRNSKISGTTVIHDNNDLYIVIPTVAKNKYAIYAKSVQDAFVKKMNLHPQIITDTELCQEDCPKIKQPYANANLILLGCLGINRAIWSGYNRFLCAVDSYYPGERGYVVQTMTNVLRNYKNHIILGSSSDAGVEEAVSFFDRIIEEQCQIAKDGKIKIPFLHQIKLHGKCLKDFQNDNQLWNSNSPTLPPFKPGCDTIRRWYQNAMGYYYTGWESYKKRCEKLTNRIISEQAYNHHYIIEFFIRSYEMIYPTGMLSKELKNQLDKLIFKSYIDFQVGPDLRWMRSFSPPYGSVRIVNRHQIAPWMAQCIMNDFFYYNFIMKGNSKSLIDFVHSEMHNFFDGILQDRWCENANNNSTGKAETQETGLSLLRYALENEQYDFFKQSAYKVLTLDKISQVDGSCVQPTGTYRHDQVSNILASYFNDGVYKWLSQHIPYSVSKHGPFNDRFIGLTHCYNVDSTIQEEYPTELTGLKLSFFMPSDKLWLSSFRENLFENFLKEEDVNKALSFAAIREGFNKNDDYLTISGALQKKCFPGEIACFWSDGLCWLSNWSSKLFKNGASPFVRDSVLVKRNDVQKTKKSPFASISTLTGTCNFDNFEYLVMNISPYMDTKWQRNILRLGHGLVLIKDSFTALTDANYDIFINWKPFGSPSFKNNTWTSKQRNKALSINLLSSDFKVEQNIDSFKKSSITSKLYSKDYLYFRDTFSGTLQKDQSIFACNVFQVSGTGGKTFRPELQAPERVLLFPLKENVSPVEVSFGKHEIEGIDTDATILMISKERIVMTKCSKLLINGKSIYKDLTPVNILIDLDKNKIIAKNCVLDDRHKTKDTDISKNYDDWNKIKTLMKSHLESLVSQKSSNAKVADDAENQSIIDAASNMKIKPVWEYNGFLRPKRITKVKKVRKDVLDIGNVKLAEIKNASIPPSQLAPLSEFWISSSYENGKVPSTNSNNWEKLPSPQWRPGLFSGNYGKGEPVKKAFQTIEFEGKSARLIRGESIAKIPIGIKGLSFYDAKRKESRHPVAIKLVDINNDGQKEIFAYTQIPKTWPRPRRDEEASFAILTQSGKEIFKYRVSGNMQDLKVIDYTGDGKQEIILATMDSQIRIFDCNGKIINHYNLFKMHQYFHKKYGRSNTRHPAAGYTTPYAVGLWRKEGHKNYKMLVSRYGNLSFIDGEGQFEGVIKAGAYCTPYMLPYGIDFDKDGKEEQLCIERGRLIHISGNSKAKIRNPGTRIFWPEIYDTTWIYLPSLGIATYPDSVYIFKKLTWGNVDRYVLIVSEKYISIYDALQKKWVYRWNPFIAVEKAAIIKNDPDSLELLIYSEDNKLSFISWDKKLTEISAFKTISTDDQIKNIHSEKLPDNKTLTILAGKRGVYKIINEQAMIKIIDGAFYDAKPLCSSGKLEAIIASSIEGEVIRFDLNGKK